MAPYKYFTKLHKYYVVQQDGVLELLVHKRVFILEMFQYPIIFQLLILTIYNCLNHRNSTKKCQLSKHSKVVLSGCYIACNMFNEVYCFVNLSHIFWKQFSTVLTNGKKVTCFYLIILILRQTMTHRKI